jgi:septal ring factor EnvC (AmiA/AmiB activator)
MNKLILEREKDISNISDSNDANDEVMSQKSDLKNFKNNVTQYTEIDKVINSINNQLKQYKEQVKPLMDQIKILKKEKKEIETTLFHFMKSNNIGVCNLPGRTIGDTKGAIEPITTSKKQPINQKYVLDALRTFFSVEIKKPEYIKFNSYEPNEKAEIIHKYICEKAPRIVNPALKLVAYVETTNNTETVIEDEDP